MANNKELKAVTLNNCVSTTSSDNSNQSTVILTMSPDIDNDDFCAGACGLLPFNPVLPILGVAFLEYAYV